MLYWLTGFLPYRNIHSGMDRYYLFTLWGRRYYIHHMHGSDPDRGLHDHPWKNAWSIVLSGWYWEQTRYGNRKVRWFNSLTGDTFHRVMLPGLFRGEEKQCWTLFSHTAEDVKLWGFLRSVRQTSNLLYRPNTDHDGSLIWTPYDYSKEGSKTNWWLTAPKGRDVR